MSRLLKTAGLLSVLMLAFLTSTAQADPPSESDYRSFWHDVFTDCVDSGDLSDLFYSVQYRESDRWTYYLPTTGSSHPRHAVPQIDRLIGGPDGYFETYRDLLHTAPASVANRLRIVILDQEYSVGYEDENTVGLQTYSCSDDDKIYLFFPYIRDDSTLAHELFHAFQTKASPTGRAHRFSSWFHEGTAEWAAQMVTGERSPAGVQAVAWRYPLAPLDSFYRWNPGNLPETVNGVKVKRMHPYEEGQQFARFISSAFGVLPGASFRSQPGSRDLGDFLSTTFRNSPINGARSDSAGSRDIDEVVNGAISSLGEQAPFNLRGGLGEAYSKFAMTRMSGVTPAEISWLQDLFGNRSRFQSWLYRPVEPRGTVNLRADRGLSVDAVEIQPPSDSTRQIKITIVGDLSPQGRLYMQGSDPELSSDSPLYGHFLPVDISENARGGSSSSGLIPGRENLAVSVVSYRCSTWAGLPIES